MMLRFVAGGLAGIGIFVAALLFWDWRELR